VGYCASSGGFTTVDVDLYYDRKLFQIGLVCIGVVSQQTLINIVISRYWWLSICGNYKHSITA